MRRGYLAVGMLFLTAAAVATMVLSSRGEEAALARIVRVERGDVLNVAALTGRLGYAEATLVQSPVPGQVAEVYVTEGQRVAAGQALLRMEAGAAERAVSAWIGQGAEALPAQEVQALLSASIVRAPHNGSVQQVMTQRHGQVAAGAPLFALTAGDQVIRCIAAEKDARLIRTGMEARLLVDGEEVGTARVTGIGPVTADAQSGRMAVEITLTPDGRLLLPYGAAVDADVILSGRRDVPVLPLEAITERETLWWYHDGICTEIPAKIVLTDEMQAWVALPEGVAVAVGEFTQGQRLREAAE